MRRSKERVTVTLDPTLLRAGTEAVARGSVSSVSAWVNAALVDRVAKERRLAAMDDAIAAYEAKHGVMTDEELTAQRRADRRRAIRISPAPKRRKRAA